MENKATDFLGTLLPADGRSYNTWASAILAKGKSSVFTAIFTKGSHVTSHPSTTQPQVATGQGGVTDLCGSAPNQAVPATAYLPPFSTPTAKAVI